MKAYKYTRFVQGFHWSANISETLVYVPDANFIIYKSGEKFGINNKEMFLIEAKEYISDIQSGKILREITDLSGNYPANTSFFIKEIPERKEENVTHSAILLKDFKEVDINLTEDGIKKLLSDNDIFLKMKKEFGESEKMFSDNLQKLISEK